jgi:prepilin-type N-terminal cleavage/methylation domain-containing protein
MKKNTRRKAFTLIEVLIVVIIMAVLAATIIPQFSESTNDAKVSQVEFNLHTIRSQIEMYHAHHLNDWPTFANFAMQMTEQTDVNGTQSGELLYGPYIQGDIPVNPFVGSNEIVAVATPGAVPTGVVAGGAGWQYDESTGDFYPNHADWDGYASP